MIISRTPVRISFFGGGTDYREYYLRKCGAVLGTAVNKYVYVSLNRFSPFFDYKIRVGYSRAELVNHVNEIVHPSVRECLKFKNIDDNLDVHISADLPARTGLGSSSSFTVGFLNALCALEGKIIPKQQLADEARHVEQDLIQENVGSQDQYHASFGGFNVIEFDRHGIRVRAVVISREKRDILERHMMVFYTRQSRFASEVAREQIENTCNGLNDSYLGKIYEMVREAEKILSDSPPSSMIQDFGALLHEGWELKKKLSSKVTNGDIDHSYILAREAGALGGKLSGAGGGGFLTLFVRPERQDHVRRALGHLLEVKCRFEDQGSTIIYMTPSSF